ncbi:hypothetical protein R4Z09_18980 [Niallia oryzisoli]|uniref:PRD domain-containing protein n=1 Tax=Niallia oryzisoli TaxID=1737571 RepID=A0ABZ2C763_9BACI
MNETSIPFLSNISSFVNTDGYTKEITKDLMILVPAIEDYLQVKLTAKVLVCKSFISHLSRLLERIYGNQLIQGEQKRMNPVVRCDFDRHQDNIRMIFNLLFPDIELTSIEIYFLVLYFARLEHELS